MRYSSIRRMDITNGPGIRVSLFTTGCDLHCPGCFNRALWDYLGGNLYTEKEKALILDLCDRDEVKGLSVLGGEPLSAQNYEDLKGLFISFKERFPEKTIWMWTGRIFEDLDEEQLEVVKLVDVLVDGPWIMSLGDFNLKYRGSSNQRIIDVQKSLETNKVVEIEL